MTGRWARLLFALGLVGLLGAGCMHRVRVESSPPGAVVRLNGERIGVTPMEFKTRWNPAGRYRLLVKLPGYRPVKVRFRDDVRLWRYPLRLFFKPRRVVQRTPHSHFRVVMVPDHGPAGTWTPADMPE